jgi:hypothetical protein
MATQLGIFLWSVSKIFLKRHEEYMEFRSRS